MKNSIGGAAVLAACLLAGCDDKCENGYKVKTEYKYVTFSEYWHESPKDEFFDGAIRVSTNTYKSGRNLELRCFKNSIEGLGRLDFRYTISTPLLARLVPELQKAGPIELIISVDGVAAGSIAARTVSHDFGISFLGELKPELVVKIAAAHKSIVAMPRQGDKKLDEAIEFGVAELAKHIQPVRKACEAPTPVTPTSPPPITAETKKS